MLTQSILFVLCSTIRPFPPPPPVITYAVHQPSARARSPRTACNFCHDKRVKCVMLEGESRCEQCAQRNTNCVFSTKVTQSTYHWRTCCSGRRACTQKRLESVCRALVEINPQSRGCPLSSHGQTTSAWIKRFTGDVVRTHLPASRDLSTKFQKIPSKKCHFSRSP